jgi:hypothetical protein
MITASTAPRDLEELAKKPIAVLLRLALSLKMFDPQSPESKGFAQMNSMQKAQQILVELQKLDAGGGVAAPAQPAVAPQPAPSPPIQAPPAVAPISHPGEVARTPQTESDPTNAGAHPHAAMAPPGAVAQTNQSAGQLLSAIGRLKDAVEQQTQAVAAMTQNVGPISQQIEELQKTTRGMARMQATTGTLLLILAESILEIPRTELAAMVSGEVEGSLQALLGGDGNSGK